MHKTITAIWPLLLAAGVLFVGGGLQGSLLAVRANGEGFSLAQIGLLMSVYSAGFVAGCQLTPLLVKNVGHIRSFTALASIASAAALAHALIVDPYAWMLLRGFSGFCFAGLAMIVESWINEMATNTNRGRVLSVYRIVDLSALALGQLLLVTADVNSFVLFSLVSILVSMALVPVALTTNPGPQPIVSAELNLRKAFRVSPLAAVGTFLVGLGSSAFWAVGPVFVQNLGYETGLISAFMSVTIMAAVLAQWPVGALSDRVNRRKLVLVIALGAAGAGFVLMMVGATSVLWLLVGAGLFGFFALSLFGLFVAQANDHAEPGTHVALNAALLLLYGVGSIIGPLLASAAMQLIGTTALFGYTTVVYLLMIAYGLWRMTRRSSIRLAAQQDFVPVPTTSPMVFELDPRADDFLDDEE